MFNTLADRLWTMRAFLSGCLTHPVFLAAVPGLCLLSFWLGGQHALVGASLAFPLAYFLIGVPKSDATTGGDRGLSYGPMHRDDFNAAVEVVFEQTRDAGKKSALFQVEIDGHDDLRDRFGQSAIDSMSECLSNRLKSVLRSHDLCSNVGNMQFAICLQPVSHLDLEDCIQLAGRMQAILEEPVSLDGINVYVTGCVGFCQNSLVLTQDGSAWYQAGCLALTEARYNGPNAIRAYSDELRQRLQVKADLRSEVIHALNDGQIRAWFQPQISTDTGRVTGFEALARWKHPKRGMIPPGEFLNEIEQAGLLERLAEVMMQQAFTALKAWDAAGIHVPQVGVNFAGPELSNPRLIEKIKWQLDRFELAPERLAVEVLETVVASTTDDTITRNVNGLSQLGCRIDLDDFGTGHASIASIRRFSVSRIKVDRSFVVKADRDPDQQRMIGAILTMAERLEVETLAEGVETSGEHALLAQLGCNHVQGFGIGKPMPFEQTIPWITQHNAKIQAAPKILKNKRG